MSARPRPLPLAAALLSAAAALGATAQAADPPGHTGILGAYPMARDGSGTSWQPDGAAMDGLHRWWGSWRVMFHADLTGALTRQGGPRGGDQAFSTSMAMAAASRTLAGGTLTARAMLSLEPLMGPQGYRLLLQTGETADGRTNLIDRQHPHDLAMELAVAYAHPLGARASAFAYLGLPGEPAVGPSAFMHRASAAAIPVAPLGHHWLDATHISFGAATAGVVWRWAKLDLSAFNGHEPDARRWNIERPRFDSRAARLSLNPWPWLAAQASAAILRSPELLHPGIDVRRYTASLSYAGTWGAARPQVTLAWGRNVRSQDLPTNCPVLAARGEVLVTCAAAVPFAPSRVGDALLAETTVPIGSRHAVFARGEHLDKDELFPGTDPFHNRVFPVGGVLAGYRFELPLRGHVRWGVGAAGALTFVPPFLQFDYGRLPVSYWIFADARLR